MKNILFFLKKLQEFTGCKIYLSLFLTILISSLEGIGIYLLVPMLAIIGLIDLTIDSVFPISVVFNWLEDLPFQLNLSFILIIYFILIAGQALLQRTQTIINSSLQQAFIRNLRLEAYQSLISAKWEFFLSKRKSDFNYILTTEISKVGAGTYSILSLISVIFFTFVQVFLAFLLSPSLTIIVLISGALLSFFLKKLVKKSKTLGGETSSLMNDYFGGVTEQFNGIKDMKSNRLESYYLNWFSKLTNNIQTNIIELVKLSSTSKLCYRVGAGFLIVFIVYLSISVLNIAPEKMVLVVLIFSRLWPKLSAIQSSIEQIVSMFPAFDRVVNLQNESNEMKEFESEKNKHYREGKDNSQTVEKEIECRNISFSYHPDTCALSEINMKLPINATTAIVGQSGAGKTTLVDIIMGLLKPDEGNVYLDGKPLSNENLLLYRNSISYVSQDPFLYHTSVRENLLMVKENATENELWEALRFAAAESVIHKLPNGLDTIIGDRGIKLSGGERQRIVLARAILRNPTILVLDEATSALDSENELIIKEAIDRMKGKMTIIIIAHRLSTIRNADQVIVLNEGKVIQQGPYDVLSQTKGAFKKMLTSQVLVQTKSIG